MLPWIISILCVLVAIILFILWQRVRAAQVEAERAAARAQELVEQARLAARQGEAHLAALHLAQADALIVVSPERVVLRLNPAARALFGPQAAPGQTLIVATRSIELDELAAHALAGGADCDRQVTLGRWAQPYRARAAPAGERGEFGVALIVSDLSELQRLGRARRDFVANISHELRTPITSIRLLVDTLRGKAAEAADTRHDLLEKISVETEALSQLAQELLDLAQIESGQTMVKMKPVPVIELVTNTVERLGMQARRKQQTLHVAVPAELRVLADADQMDRVLGNLLHNAIKFTPPAGQIWVRASEHDGDVVIEVADNGPGIPPDDLPRVFERFFRGDRSRVRPEAHGGTGLGLAIAKHVIEAHGGRIWVESEGRPGQGAVFHFTLPAA